MRITELNEQVVALRASRQPLPMNRLLAIAENAGFTVRNGKHINCVHESFRDIHVGLTHSNSAVCKLRLADALDALSQRLQEEEQKIQAAFNASSENRLEALRAKLPPHVTAELTQNGNVVLRDVQIPQIGVTLYSAEQDARLESHLRYEFGATKNAFYAELSKLRSLHDAEAVFDAKGNFTGKISHIVYGDDYAMEMPAYSEGDAGLVVDQVFATYREQIEMKDLEQSCRKEELLAKPFIGSILVTHAEQRGERHNHVRIKDPQAGDLKFTFTTFSNQRVAGDGTRGRITDAELDALAAKVESVEKRLTRLNDRWAAYRAA